jgi:hypothetical protein
MISIRSLLPLAALALLAAPAQAGKPLPKVQDPTFHPLPREFSMRTPSQVTGVFFADLTGILHIGTKRPLPDPPLWWSYLSRRTEAKLRALNALDAEAGERSFDYDWLCQCRSGKYVKAVPNIIVDSSSATQARLTVGIRRHRGESDRIILHYVNEGGWKIDEIIDDRGIRFTDAMDTAMADRMHGHKALANQRRP